jgi:peptidyl-prolyl cis-trans isomerase A (cyclophilin A)
VGQGAPEAFFSYCREDSEFALRLAGDLKTAGASVWLDQLDITPGDRWDRAVENALTNCSRMLVILSPDSVSSTNVMDEVSFALEEQKIVIPVFHRDCTVPFRLRRVQHVDFRQDYARGLQELLKTLPAGQCVEQRVSGISDVGSQGTVSGFGELRRATEQSRLEDEYRGVAEQKRLELERQQSTEERLEQVGEPATAQGLREQGSELGLFPKFSASRKLALAGCGILIVVSILFWESLRGPTGKQPAGTQQEEVKSEASDPPKLGKLESNQPPPSAMTGGHDAALDTKEKTGTNKAVMPGATGSHDRALLRPALLKDRAPDTYKVEFETTRGNFTISVTRAWAPLGADRFYNLVKHHFYDDAHFFRVIPNFVVQFGISAYPPVSAALENATIKDDPPSQSNRRGTVAFGTSGPNSRTTQVFINLKDNVNLDSQGFAPFGVVDGDGMNVVGMLYDQYGESAGMDQAAIIKGGKDYITAQWPRLDMIKSATLGGGSR